MESWTLPLCARLTWLVGPPGAGKSTLASRQGTFDRVVELTDMLGPLVDPIPIRKGILDANGRLVEVIRRLELHEENAGLPPLLVVAGLVPEEVLLPVLDGEAVLLLRPERSRWLRQLYRRPVGAGSSRQYDDYMYAERWYDRFDSWVGQPGVQCIDMPEVEQLIGKTAPGR
ncbi:MAG: hypothetical protein AMXMBFR64_61010 [Myxococcales bacterium]